MTGDPPRVGARSCQISEQRGCFGAWHGLGHPRLKGWDADGWTARHGDDLLILRATNVTNMCNGVGTYLQLQFISIYTQKISVYIYIDNTRSCFVSVVLVCLGHQGYLNRRLTTFFWLATPRTRILAFCIAASQPFEALQQTPLFCRLCLRRRWAQGCCHVCKRWCPGQESLLKSCSEMDQLLRPGICHLSPFPKRNI